MRLVLLIALFTALPVHAERPADFLARFSAEALRADPAFGGFDPGRGEHFFKNVQQTDWSCSTCHTDDPSRTGRHQKTGKSIAALAPAANPERFTNPDKVAKWFRRNCNDVLQRECSPQEKGDVIAYLLSLGA
jgi:hypothetical protein